MKKVYTTILAILITLSGYSQIVNVGEVGSPRDGDKMEPAMIKINAEFERLSNLITALQTAGYTAEDTASILATQWYVSQYTSDFSFSDTTSLLATQYYVSQNGSGDFSFSDTTDLLSTKYYVDSEISGLAGGHDAVTLSGGYNYLTLSTQQITLGQIDLTTDVTGVLPDANVANDITLDNYQPLESTLTDIADGTIAENLVNTAYPWADNEVANDITINSVNATTESAFEGALDLQDLQGTLTDTQVPNDITITSISQIQDITATSTEINYTDGVTSAIQTQINTKVTRSDSTDVFATPTQLSDSLDNHIEVGDSLTIISANGISLSYTTTGDTLIIEPDTTELATQEDISSLTTSSSGLAYDPLYFKIGTTTNAPSAGDSTLTHGAFQNKLVQGYRDGSYANITHTDSTIEFDPAFSSGEEFWIVVRDSVGSSIALRDTAESFPVVENYSSGTDQTFGTAKEVTMPAGISVGNLLVCFLAVDGSGTIEINTSVSGSNWYLEDSLAYDGGNGGVTGAVAWKIAEGSDTLQFTASSSYYSAYTIYNISGHGVTDTLMVTKAEGASTNMNPPALDPAISQKYLWIVAGVRDGDSNQTATEPADFTNLINVLNSSSGAILSTARREYETGTSYDPGAFSTTIEDWGTFTIAIKPQ